MKTSGDYLHLKRADFLLGGVILLATLILCIMMLLSGGAAGGRAEVRVDNEEFGIYDLAVDREVVIDVNGHSNTMVIEGGRVRMTHADCPDLYCVRHRPIEAAGDTIVCLPNRVVIKVIDGEEAKLDAIVN